MLLRLHHSLGHSGAPETCYYVETSRELDSPEMSRLRWLASSPGRTAEERSRYLGSEVIEIGSIPRIATAFSDIAVSICEDIGVPATRIEQSIRYPLTGDSREHILAKMDPVTQMVFEQPLESFPRASGTVPRYSFIDTLSGGIEALRLFNAAHKLGIDEQYMRYYVELAIKMRRNFTDVELFQLANANSDHSRHLFWRAKLVIDGVEMPHSLMEIIQRPWKRNPGNSIVAFSDNAGAITGSTVIEMVPRIPGRPSGFELIRVALLIIVTAETHNHPTLVEPFQGAATGPGGRIRDLKAFGRGSRFHAGTIGYFVGNLHIPGYEIPGELIGGDKDPRYATPLHILTQGSEGASHYANLYGEPAIAGFCRTFGQMIGHTRYEARKPVLFTAGLGRGEQRFAKKEEPEIGMLIVGLGGPAYPIGFGGGTASSGAQSDAKADQNSVQRANAQMKNRTNRVLLSCVECGEDNPIAAIHDQGAGGPSNVLTELVEKIGGRLDLRLIRRGDPSMTSAQVWVCEYQERYGLLVRPERLAILMEFCRRENVNCEVIGRVTGDKRIVVVDGDDSTPVDLSLPDVLTDLPRQTRMLTRVRLPLAPLSLPDELTIERALAMVFRRQSVGSKGHLHHKIDRSVTGRVVLQPCVGPTHIGVADCGVTRDSFFETTGAMISHGEQPIIGLIDPKAMVRMSIAEALLNGSAACIELEKVKFQLNWMWAVKENGEGARLWDAVNAVADFMDELALCSIGGKDSSSMATEVCGEKAITPGQLVVTAIAPVADISRVLTPALSSSRRILGYLDLGLGKNRMGGSALAEAHGQIGDDCPDVGARALAAALKALRVLIERGLISSLHDVSDGGLITTIAEMCMAGNRGARIKLRRGDSDTIRALFHQESGVVFEFRADGALAVAEIMQRLVLDGMADYHVLGETGKRGAHNRLEIFDRENKCVFSPPLTRLRRMWEATSLRLQEEVKTQATVEQERSSHAHDTEIPLRLSFSPRAPFIATSVRPKVAILRDEGTNGDREMTAAFYFAGFDPVDVNTRDMLNGSFTSFDDYRGFAACGGFSRADAFGSARGWAAILKFNPRIAEMFRRFHRRKDVFALGVCNGCQLMTQLGWILPAEDTDSHPYLTHNSSGGFEHRMVGVAIEPSNAIFFAGMTGSVLPIVVAHGEGRWVIPKGSIRRSLILKKIAPLRYVGPDGLRARAYPFNPNGSQDSIAGLISRNGRYLAMMPHPERMFLPSQYAYVPRQWRQMQAAPWLRMFQNMYAFAKNA